ncbi:D-aminoacyl-tRNA deacylase [Desulfosporosinus sp. BICA1-9]|uniref:D-aminoacyl-tRNA deacylase n=1 Tax=Desulfosporosinus sp. BICA1-9 TaxID=1531958 RepID=UPI00054BE3AE|nr:D-aminoacyl-tRNA deacylase [Desulfosporosinus sp. BICA1-9]KJS48527.1 MAG: D-tyrosyl-tRNA(Tyr) deacylase [Peptococcaceae bacterium BRH_c23]KJS77944.1 MAG: D-tyrosyl-tRNA(Tyr) deacylase [Desulfosporosinus sp. BICA1-9]
MRSVIQRVKRASVTVHGETVGQISGGLLVLLAVGQGDGADDLTWMVDKLVGLRIFEDEEQKMNRSILDVGGEILVVSQFTLYGDCWRGKRPSFSSAAPPEQAKEMFERSVEAIRSYGLKVETGVFQAEMDVELINAGPVTILLDSEKKF